MLQGYITLHAKDWDITFPGISIGGETMPRLKRTDL